MDSKGNVTLEILVVGIIIIAILGLITYTTQIAEEKISKNTENENIENIISQTCDYLINNPGVPINWEDYKSKRVGLAIVNTDENIIPNSVSYAKFLELGRDYERLVTKQLFDTKLHSSMELIPQDTSISSVKIGENAEADNIYSVSRLVKCDFFKKFVIIDFLNEGKCNHNHEDYSCGYFKIFKKNLDKMDYYLIFDESEKYNVKWSLDTTLHKTNSQKMVSDTKICLNNEIANSFSDESSSIIFVHLNKKNTKAVLVGVYKDFDKEKLSYPYFKTQTCEFVIKAWS